MSHKSKTLKTILLLSPALLLLGCNSTTSIQGPQDARIAIPGQWTNATTMGSNNTRDDITQWWSRFNDPILTSLIETALHNSPDLRTARSRIVQSRAQRGLQATSLWPNLSASLSAQGTETRNHDTDSTTRSDSYAASMDAGWEIDLWGKNHQALQAADATLAATTENYYASQVSLAAEVASDYFTYLAQQQQLANTRTNLSLQEESTQLTQWREESGITDALDSQQAISSLEQTRASILSQEQNLSQYRNALAVLLGQVPGSLDSTLQTANQLPAAPDSIRLGIPANDLQQRPDVRAAEYTLLSAIASLKSSQAERYPSIKLSASLSINEDNIGDLLSPTATVGRLVGSLGSPIFDAGRIQLNIVLADEQAKQALIAYESTLLTALREVKDALVAIDKQSQGLQHQQRATAAATEALTLAQAQYEAGTIDTFNLISIQSSQLSSQNQLISAQANLDTAHIQLYKALGGGWTPLTSESLTNN